MSETQLSDQYLYQSSLKSNPEIKVSSSKRVPHVIDLNQGSYQNGVITIDATAQLNGSEGFASLRDAYIVLPYKVSMRNGATAQTAAANRLCATLKCGNWNVIDSMSLELNGKTIVSMADYKLFWNKDPSRYLRGTAEAIAGDKVTYFNGLDAVGNYSEANMTTAKQYASQAEYTVAVIGEHPYAEKTGDLDDLALPAGQIEYVKELASTGTKVIVVLFEGRPRLLGEIPENVHAVVHGLLACEQGGKAMAEIIYGQVNPSGRLPITYPKDAGNVVIPYNHRVSTQCADDDDCEMQWDFGTGLSYTEFTYSDLTLSKTNVTSSSDTIDVSVVVTNSGSMAGKDTVILFLIQPYWSVSADKTAETLKAKEETKFF